MSFDVGKAIARLRAEYDVYEVADSDPTTTTSEDGHHFAGNFEKAHEWAYRIHPALAVGVRDEHDMKLLLAALGWRESSNAWGRVMGLDEIDVDGGAEEHDEHR